MSGATIQRPDYPRVKREVRRVLTEFELVEPPVDPVKIARNLGISVYFAEFTRALSNVSGFFDAAENSIVVNKDESPLRQTFTVAHELGHKLLHEDWARSSDYKVLLRDATLETNDPIEKEANAFAAHLLVPRSMLDRYWTNLTIEQLSQLFAVSVPVIKNRILFEYGA